MAQIHLLDHDTIDKIAAGEVVEKPASVVKELVENSIDAGADSITVEIKNGGIEFIRVTDNGCGIEKKEIEKAFLRHATSKIQNADDLTVVESLGFRGEALSSISAVAKVELITKTRDSVIGAHYETEGNLNKNVEEIGAPDGTTIIVRNLFFNTPVRRKFLKQPATEGGYICDLMEHLAMSKPEISFKFVMNGSVKFATSGNGDLKEVIYRIFGKEAAKELIPVQAQTEGMKLSGYLGKPVMNRSNRNFENYFVNRRYIKSSLVAKGIEEGYKEYLMQHKYPFVVLNLDLDTAYVDVNVHPTKMDVRFTNGQELYDFLVRSVAAALKENEMIPDVVLGTEKKPETEVKKQVVPEPFEVNRRGVTSNVVMPEKKAFTVLFSEDEEGDSIEEQIIKEPVEKEPVVPSESQEAVVQETGLYSKIIESKEPPSMPLQHIIKAKETVIVEKPVQMNFFEEKMLSSNVRDEYKILGQVFDTYWIISFRDKLLFVDQHAAHEKVRFERLMKELKEKNVMVQSVNPPVILTLSSKEESALKQYWDYFIQLGFEMEEFGGSAYALRGMPMDLYGCNEKDFFIEILDELIAGPLKGTADVIRDKIASMSCKAAVKGNTAFSVEEMEALVDELLTLDNPYNCPHGRPTIVSMSKYEMEKKFKRIV